ncbi:Mitochondrial dicarboxylate/tricarboxylate transporter family protein [Babesia bovis T2Bo]|uniref:Mitochondrial carrier protein family protein n=1 Tax=Babesia bovis TaxID=5865 RepID=A7ANE5_BABBO|nr:Mitochondrial dicarboxylate/tricarboxylate transporter family protein [Babesia bovis T2Bo]EDO08079.1 Mitochondrial dicarboxylate/tricarboxylate transporter family protein [Babesia bovis T2Bo]BAN64258.1 mitochondrial carrier protein family protein [Babesia bovis]|eukprot:XP_001611647.1 mitochondrial carrier protein family protein [Babesia bovis T2Bo]
MATYNLDFLPLGAQPIVKPCMPFILGGTSGCLATVCIQPIDMVKVRIQLAAAAGHTQPKPIALFRHMLKHEGLRSMYKGLDAACARQILYTTTRLGLFRTISDVVKERQGTQRIPFYQKCLIGLFSGAAGAFIGNPADLALVRMQSNLSLPVAQRKNYGGIFSTVCRISQEEGIGSLWKGATPTIVRAMALNVAMLATYDQSKETLSPYIKDKSTLTVASSAISAWFAVVASLPFDYVKTCLQKQGSGKAQYSGVTDCFIKNYREGGLKRFYSSYSAFYMRIAPHIIITLILREYFDHLFTRK